MGMSEPAAKPLIGVPVNLSDETDETPSRYTMGTKYISSTAEGAGGMPMLIPALGDASDTGELLNRLDGLLLSGGRANIEPRHYGGPPFPDEEFIDPARDATVLPLIRACIDRGIPVFGICRGIQELNVALGGSLHYRLHLLPGKMDHRMLRDVTREERYAPRHKLSLTPEGYLAGLMASSEATVNTLHGQGLDRLAEGLEIEALAPDGVVEAVRLPAAKSFTVGVQWHAEWALEDNPISRKLFAAFGDAAKDYALHRAGPTRVTR